MTLTHTERTRVTYALGLLLALSDPDNPEVVISLNPDQDRTIRRKVAPLLASDVIPALAPLLSPDLTGYPVGTAEQHVRWTEPVERYLAQLAQQEHAPTSV